MPMKVFLPFWLVVLAAVFWSLRHIAPGIGLISFACGLVVWSIVEYLCHRYLFHASCTSHAIRYFVFLIHGNHHELPTDALRNMMPLSVTVPVAAGLWYLCARFGGIPGEAAFAGFLLGYVGYDFIHYYCHQGAGRYPIGRFLKRHHLLHHHGAPDWNFGVSSSFWDRIFSTQFRPGKGRRSDDAHRP